MKRTLRNTLLLLIAAALAGCALNDGRPSVSGFDTPGQGKLKSAAHWQVVANDVAAQVAASVKAANLAAPLVVAPAAPAGTFSRVFSSQLRSALLAQGAAVGEPRPGTLEITVAVDEVRHNVQPERYRPGLLTMLTAGVLVLRQAFVFDRLSGNEALGVLGVGVDAVRSAEEIARRPATEIVLTTALRLDGRFLMHRSDVYYIDDADASLYTPPAREFRLVGGAS